MNGWYKQTASLLFCFFIVAAIVTSLPVTAEATNTDQAATEPSTVSNLQSGMLWNTSISWNFTGTPTAGLASTEILGKRREWLNPVVLDGVVYAGATSIVHYGRHWGPQYQWINVYAFEAKSGQLIWSYQANFSFNTISNLAVADGKVFFAANGGYSVGEGASCLIALDATNGSLLWRAPCDVFYTNPAAEDGRVFINSDHSLIALNATGGNVMWRYTIDDLVHSPTTANGIVYATSNNHRIYALNASDGSHIWNIYTDKGFNGVTYADGAVYATSIDGNIYALNAATGTTLWKQTTTPPEFKWANSTFQTKPFYDSGLLYFTCRSSQDIDVIVNHVSEFSQTTSRSSVYALDAATGNKVWNYTIASGQLDSAVSVNAGVIYTKDGRRLLAFSSQNGALIWNYTISNFEPQTQPAIVNGVLYESFSDGQMYALDSKALGVPDVNPFFILIGGVVIGVDLLVALVFVVAVIVVLPLYLRRRFRKRKNQLL